MPELNSRGRVDIDPVSIRDMGTKWSFGFGGILDCSRRRGLVITIRPRLVPFLSLPESILFLFISITRIDLIYRLVLVDGVGMSAKTGWWMVIHLLSLSIILHSYDGDPIRLSSEMRFMLIYRLG